METPLRFLVKPAHDEKLPDGFVRAGWRKVRKDGKVFFQGQHRQSDKLLPYIGAFVYCEIVDMWGSSILIHPEGYSSIDARNHSYGKPSKIITPDNI